MALKILKTDPSLKPFAADLELRMQNYKDTKKALVKRGRNLSHFANGHH